MPRPRTFDPARVLDAAVEVFRESGFEGTSVPELVERLGICRQSLYTAFGDKRGLYLQALERWGRIEVDAKLALLADGDSPLEGLRTLLRGLADLAPRCPSEGCLTARAIVEIHDDPEALAIVDAQVERLERGFREALASAQRQGELRSEVRPERLARALVAAMYGLGVLARLPSSGPRVADAVSVLLGMIDDAAV